MNTVLWIVAGLLAIAFLAAGLMKLQPTAKLRESGMDWVDDVPDSAPRLIGVAEALGAIGLVLPALVDVAPVLVPISATALAVVMLGAVVFHLRRHEIAGAVPALVLGILSAFVAVARFGPQAF